MNKILLIFLYLKTLYVSHFFKYRIAYIKYEIFEIL